MSENKSEKQKLGELEDRMSTNKVLQNALLERMNRKTHARFTFSTVVFEEGIALKKLVDEYNTLKDKWIKIQIESLQKSNDIP